MQCGGDLDVRAVELARELEPILDGAVGILVTDLPGGELLERGGQHAHLHELGLEGARGHGV
jgi:hypothetical protein